MQHKSRNLKGKAEVVNIHFQPEDFFLFPSSFPTNDKEDCFVLTCVCHSYLYSNKDKQKLETGSTPSVRKYSAQWAEKLKFSEIRKNNIIFSSTQ